MYNSNPELTDLDQDINITYSHILRFGPLALAEIDEDMATFDLSSPTKIVNLIRKSGIEQLKQVLKV